MKKKLIAFLIGAVISTLLFSPSAGAAEKYLESKGTDISIVLDENGNAEISETWNYFFGGDKITRLRRWYLNGGYSLSDFSVYFDDMELSLLSASDDSRPVGCAAVYTGADGMTYVEIYMNALNETHTVTIEYTVNNAVILHDDIAEFRWNLTSSNEPAAISKLTGSITLPEKTNENSVWLWAHGPLNGNTFKSTENGMVSGFGLSVVNIPKTTAVDIRTAMPKELFPNASRREAGNALERIKAEENAYIDNAVSMAQSGANQLANKIKTVLGGIIAGSLFLAVFGIAVALPVDRKITGKKKLKKLRGELPQAPRYLRELPDNLPPCVVCRLYGVYHDYLDSSEKHIKVSNRDAFSATLLDLIERGIIGVCVQNGFTRFMLPTGNLPCAEHEITIIEMLTAAAEGKPHVSSLAFNRYLVNNTQTAILFRKRFDSEIDELFNSYRFTIEYKRKKLPKPLRALLLLILAAGGAFFGITLSKSGDAPFLYPMLCATAALSLAAAFIITGVILFHDYTVLTPDGENRFAQWSAFARWLDDFASIGDNLSPALAVWKRYLIYAVALGRGTKASQQLKIRFPEVTQNNDFHRFDESILMSDYAGHNAYAVSVSSDGGSSDCGGGFSDSGGGGCDSGSGGGDFD